MSRLKDYLLQFEDDLKLCVNSSSNVLQSYKEYETILKSNSNKQRGNKYVLKKVNKTDKKV